MSGYCGYSMSNNAIDAYDSGEKPISKFNKKDLEELKTFLIECKINEEKALHCVKKLTVKKMKEWLKLSGRSSWHHTSKMYNVTDFYSIAYCLSGGGLYLIEELTESIDRYTFEIDYKIDHIFKVVNKGY